MATTLYATFNDLEASERATGALLDYGVRAEDVSLVRQGALPGDKPTGSEDVQAAGYAPGTGKSVDNEYDNLAWQRADPGYDPDDAAKSGLTATSPIDAGAGAIKGAGVGLGVGTIAAMASLFVPGVGLVAGGGALAIALGGLAATTGAGAIAGAITGYLKDQGMETHLATQYGTAASRGALISVSVPSGNVDESTVRSILDKYGAVNVTNLVGSNPGGYLA